MGKINDYFTGNYGVSKEVFKKAKKIFKRLHKDFGIPKKQIEINEDCVVHYYLIDDEERVLHFEIRVDETDTISYECVSIEADKYSITYNGVIDDTIEYLEEFIEAGISQEIFEGFEGKYVNEKIKDNNEEV
jgi:hypothetical protein